MAAKFTIEIKDFRPFERNTLQGFATIRIRELGLTIKDLGIHRQGEKSWVGLPGKPRLNGDTAVKDETTGKVAYVPILAWDSKQISERFAQRVFEALEQHFRHEAALP